ncbi:protein phosphatase 2C domain-containing protein [Nocardia sp. NPDC050630]|uniref:protein phosphatase 2C domain-containing protein n=1 Tax=Nocardia sp. NPDC050630 TaxID=3364321 RepID=UPI00378E76F2
MMAAPHICTAQLAAQSDEDHLFVTSAGVVVLDGATSHRSVDGPTGGHYAEELGKTLAEALDRESELTSLVTILEGAIDRTIAALRLERGAQDAPSCTVALVRTQPSDRLDLLLLGDSTIAVGHSDGTTELITDTRLQELGLPAVDQYKSRLLSGAGYDKAHRSILVKLQRAQQCRRNRAGGYWIASTDPAAARHAFTATRSVRTTDWVVLATDGAADCIEAVGAHWRDLAAADDAELASLLHRCHMWEAEVDPNGVERPRAKRHDDKTIAVVRLS